MSELTKSKGGITKAERDVKQNPKSAEASYYLGLCYCSFMEERNIQKAKQAFEKAIALKKEYPEAYIGLADCLWAEEQKEKAISKLEKAITTLPEESSLHGKLGTFLQAMGKFKDAAEYFNNALKYEKNDKQAQIWGRKIRELGVPKCPYCSHDIAKVCNLCPDCLRDINICSHCQHQNILFLERCISCKKPLPPYESWVARKDNNRSSYIAWDKSINAFRKKWFYPFHSAIKQEILPNIPSPVIAGDIVIIPNPDDLGMIKSILGLNIHSGKVLWEWQIGHLLSYSCTPIPVNDSLYIPSHGYLRKRLINANSSESHKISAGEEVTPHEYCPPLHFFHKDNPFIIFASDKSLSIYNLQNEQNCIANVPFQKPDDNIAGIVWNGEKVTIISQKGEILSFGVDKKIESLQLLKGNIGICSPPCSFGKDIYFEFMYENDSQRRICVFAPDNGTIVEIELEHEEGCNSEHFHWKFPPLTSKDGVLLTSDLYSRIYTIKREEDVLITVTKEMDVSKGITNISQEFSAVMGSYLISSAGRLFFYVNLDNPEEKGLMDIGSLVIAQPAISQKGLVLFLCIDGLYCYEVV